MDLPSAARLLQAELGIQIRLLRIPREIMERNRKDITFFEVATLAAEVVYREKKGNQTVDIRLTKFIPSLAEVSHAEIEALKTRAIKSGFDFIDFWAIAFEYIDGAPFQQHWQAFRLRQDRSLPITSDQYHVYPSKVPQTACVRVVDVFGCDTSITIPILPR